MSTELVKSGTLTEVMSGLPEGEEFVGLLNGSIRLPADIIKEDDGEPTWRLFRSSQHYGRYWQWRVVSVGLGEPICVWRGRHTYPREEAAK